MTAPGWYPDPSGTQQHRYFDGYDWTAHLAPVQQPTAIVEGPNHVLHGILTLFTWPLCGGWGWIWLFIALDNKKRVRYVR